LRGEIAGWLSGRSLGSHVLAFTSAPAHLGGTGGVLVLLAPAGAGGGAKTPTGTGGDAKPSPPGRGAKPLTARPRR
jgi:hypothetical protein